MVKKAIKSEIRKKDISKEKNVDKILLENFVSLQKVMTNLSVKFDNLSSQISKLLDLFELSAKALVQKEIKFEPPSIDDKKILEKLDNLQDQNRTIARGLTLVHERIGEGSRLSSEAIPVSAPPVRPSGPQRMPFTPPKTREEYQRSPFKGF